MNTMLRKHRVLGHGLARALDESEIARVGGGHGEGGGFTPPVCPNYAFLTSTDPLSGPICDVRPGHEIP